MLLGRDHMDHNSMPLDNHRKVLHASRIYFVDDVASYSVESNKEPKVQGAYKSSKRDSNYCCQFFRHFDHTSMACNTNHKGRSHNHQNIRTMILQYKRVSCSYKMYSPHELTIPAIHDRILNDISNEKVYSFTQQMNWMKEIGLACIYSVATQKS